MNTFEAMGNAAVEKIHTQFLSWFFNSPNDSIPIECKEIIFNGLTGHHSTATTYKAICEIDNIDIIIMAEDEICAIENKLKSREHSNQTTKYIIPEELGNYKKRYYVFLSLVGDDAENSIWLSKKYSDIHDYFSTAITKIDNAKKEYVFIKEYIDCLNKLNTVFIDFMKNYLQYDNVFSDGSKSKKEKICTYSDEKKDYIRSNNLETIFQRAFLKMVFQKIIKQYFTMNIGWEISETNGNALIQIDIDRLNVNGATFILGIQYQNTAVKINARSANYLNSKKDEIAPLLNIFKDYADNSKVFNKFNPPHQKAYVSISTKIGLQEKSMNEITEICKNIIPKAMEAENELKKRITTAST